MKVFANENLFEPIIDYLRRLDHDVLSIRDAGLSGISDDEVYQRACKEKRVIITMDKDFSRIFRFPPERRRYNRKPGYYYTRRYTNKKKKDLR